MKANLLSNSAKRNLLFLILFIVTPQFIFNELSAQPYLRYFENGKVGFIDTTGKVVIKARFAQTGDFSEGLAPARLKGLYGYIDTTGEYVIPPKYDYAMEFHDGLAIVYNDSVPCYINKAGNIPFPVYYKKLYNFENGFAKAVTYDNKYDLIDLNGNVLIKGLLFDWPLQDSIIIINGIVDIPLLKNCYLMNRSGKTVVPSGYYRYISPFSEGFARVSYSPSVSENSRQLCWGFINRNYEIAIMNNSKFIPASDGFHEGLLPVSIWKTPLRNPQKLWDESNYFCGYIDTLGNLIFSDSNYFIAKDFSNGTGFMINKYETAEIDRTGRVIKKYPANLQVFYRNSEGVKIIRDNYSYYLEDSTGNKINDIKYARAITNNFLKDGFFFLEGSDSGRHTYFNICNDKGIIINKNKISDIDQRGFVNGFLRILIENRKGYVNRNGKIIWLENKKPLLNTLNIDYRLLVGYNFSFLEENTDELTIDYPQGRVNLLVNRDSDFKYNDVKGEKVYLINSTQEVFKYQDIFLIRQALSPDGVWRDIEKLAPKIDGPDPYINYMLTNGWYLSFTFPQYTGSFATKIRYKFMQRYYKNPNERTSQSDEYFIKCYYSEPYEGSINPAQLWRDYNPLLWENEHNLHDAFMNYYLNY
ncbi:MAG: WG repeat-containing protein [Ignavibacteria bacterium]|nr:WG repeat-containing protein [Ignavibacteria bacterium]